MEHEISPNASAAGCSTTGCLLWFLGGVTLSFTIVLSLVLLVFLMASLALNAYLGWQLSNLQITVSQKPAQSPPLVVVTATPQLAMAPASTPQPTETPAPPLPTATATAVPPSAQVQAQMATVSAITGSTEPAEEAAAFVLPTTTPTAAAAVPLEPAQPEAPVERSPPVGVTPVAEIATDATPAHLPAAGDKAEVAPAESNNTYTLIPIDDERESRPAAEHGDLNLKLRAPERLDGVELGLVTIDGSGIDSNAPQFGKVFRPDVVATYAIHAWDWAKNDKGELIKDGKAILVGLKTTPGQPIFIPPTKSDIFQGKYYATVLYADEDSITFVYSRHGNVVKGYTVHLLGLQTDPNLVKAFRESKGNMLPGLTLDTPVGRATDELIVAIRDNGTFLDARSLKDWWD